MKSSLILVAIFFAIGAFGLTQETSHHGAPHTPAVHLPSEIPRWLAEGAHQDIPWNVRIQKPVLTFQQREVVKVTAEIDAALLQKGSVQRNLIFILKISDETGKWLPGENYVTRHIEKDLGHDTNLQMESEVFLLPGKYTIATIVYDSVLGQRNLALNPVEVPALKNDPLPELWKQLPRADFVHGELQNEEIFQDGRLLLPLNTRRRIDIDFVIDFSASEGWAFILGSPEWFGRSGSFARMMRYKKVDPKHSLSTLLQSASVVGSINPSNGCMRVSAFDSLKQRTFIETRPASEVDWQDLHNKVLGPDRNTISVAALQARQNLQTKMVEQIDKFIKLPTCSAGEPVHVVIILGNGREFPSGSQKARMEDCRCSLFYLRKSDTRLASDDLKGMLAPLSPKTLDFRDPEQFRKKLAELIKDIQEIAK